MEAAAVGVIGRVSVPHVLLLPTGPTLFRTITLTMGAECELNVESPVGTLQTHFLHCFKHRGLACRRHHVHSDDRD